MDAKTPEREALEAKAEELGLTFQANIGDEKLAGRIKKALTEQALPVPALRVTGPKKGFRRAGRTFGPEPVDIPLADLGDADLTALEAEPNLVTQRIGDIALSV